jgi:hypothetical protein
MPAGVIGSIPALCGNITLILTDVLAVFAAYEGAY